MKQILVIEQATTPTSLGSDLELAGFSVEAVGLAAAKTALAVPFPDFVILNAGGSQGLGLVIVRSIRDQSPSQTQIMVLTGPAADYDRVAWLQAGVDDYMTEPYSTCEVVARVRARMQFLRCTGSRHLESRASHNLVFVPSCNQIRFRGAEVQLTHRQYTLLARLHLARGHVVSRSDLLRDVFGYKTIVKTRVIDVHIARLRSLLGDNGMHPRHILTVRNCGYRLDDPQS